MQTQLKIKGKRIAAACLAGLLALQPAGLSLTGAVPFLTSMAASFQGVVTADNLNVRNGAGTGYSSVAKLANGTQVSVTGETTGSDGKLWYQISFGSGQSGFVRADYIKQRTTYSASDAAFEQWMNAQGFPESYKNDLRGLHQKYPNWIFKAQQTGLDWNTVIEEESRVGRNLIAQTSKSSWKSTADGAFDWANNSWPGFDGSAWNAASSEIISYYMDPRNFLSEPYIFQFELQSYDAAVHTREGLMDLIEGTFLDKEVLIPLENSQITAGTVVEVAADSVNAANQASGGSSSSGTSSGSGQSSSGSEVGPGVNLGGANTGGQTSQVGPGVSGSTSGTGSTTQIGAGPGGLSLLYSFSAAASRLSAKLSDSVFRMLGGIDAFAGRWREESTDPIRWVYQNDDGTNLANGWYWLDGNADGIAECYYFYADGAMAYNTTVDGYRVNNDGKWIDDNGTIQTRDASTISAPGSTGSAAGTGNTASTSASTAPGGTTESSTSDGTAPDSTSGVQTVQMRKVAYADIIMKAAEVSGVSPYVLASMILQEQGSGTSDSISGTNSSYPGIYNFYNLGAYAHDGMGAVEAGLNYAAESGNADRPWNTIEKAIIGGAKAYGSNYVAVGQDTFYLKKFNVQGSNLYKHQYMTNVPAAAAEGAKISEAYSAALKATALEFKIPVFTNMPEEPCTMPTADGNPNNKLSQITVDGYTLTPTYSMDTAEYSLIVDANVASVNINAVTIDQNATVSGAGTVSLAVGMNTIPLTVTAQNGATRVYTLNISRREGAAADSSTGTPDNGQTQTGPGMPEGNAGASAEGSTVILDPGSAQGTADSTDGGGAVSIGAAPGE